MPHSGGRPTGAKNDPNRKSVDFRQSNIKRAVRAAVAAGMAVKGIEIDPASGVIRVLVDKPAA
jgi:hypothetical protein